MIKAEYYLLDVFTDHQFGGNQLAVFPDSREIDPALMQNIARELNLSETVFLYPVNDDGSYDMRIFTPGTELPTAGHPTIGTSFLIGDALNVPDGIHTLSLNQKVGLIKVDLTMEAGKVNTATMYQPLPDFQDIYPNRDQFVSLLSLDETDLMEHPIQKINCGVPFVIIPVNSLDAIRRIRFRLDLWSEMTEKIQAFVYAFTPMGETPGGDLHGRMFAPEAGILEDPATGSANGPLGCYVTHYGIKASPYLSEQGFEMGRPSLINIQISVDNDNKINSVAVGGKSVLAGKGEIFLA